ncbi:MAG: hypothetical protein US62_C0010G0015 [Candidatus Woesebacteria bacterium GW2011_GWA1_37_8]|uniref:Uncharacterized protein n=2 Tax=Candidatus Woeseibacteriota TaxID=1752722 RepID=A0A0G0LHH0_9BACT|nr:MAG: hypothetical protein US39_C0006G0010 [Microgenomates group bacterium GW2011_GWC1_37_12b]KKQ45730.1 MAG: hypothetical protein US62_C0010G0015 [Candidatus Woesebacteria bacterium GW2011_GWA1_37_8]KKQ87380.1 MAG: hypothetical protein UT10_C0007G0038 [Candidatus Woesebacteria bacterium GW2011_GWB1_38_8b]
MGERDEDGFDFRLMFVTTAFAAGIIVILYANQNRRRDLNSFNQPVIQSVSEPPDYGLQWNWDCTNIDPEHGRPNFYRAVLFAGDRRIVEPGPYKYFAGPNNPSPDKSEKTIYDMNQMKLVYLDDTICVDP